MIGPYLRLLRVNKKLTQGDLAARCGTLGWDASENTITKIETQIRCVSDQELITLATALRVKLKALFPKQEKLF